MSTIRDASIIQLSARLNGSRDLLTATILSPSHFTTLFSPVKHLHISPSHWLGINDGDLAPFIGDGPETHSKGQRHWGLFRNATFVITSRGRACLRLTSTREEKARDIFYLQHETSRGTCTA
ncbi:hypothetical protein VTL71DRAFT_14520, partial [Oculimacula yallundae]